MFIEYLSNSSSRPFNRLIETFTSKEHQADEGNLCYVHLIVKILSFQDKNKLFELAQNDDIDIIKPDEIDNVLAKGVIHHKDDSIEFQIDVVACLNHHWHSSCLVPY